MKGMHAPLILLFIKDEAGLRSLKPTSYTCPHYPGGEAFVSNEPYVQENDDGK